jgi:hypothetical protein
MALSPVELISGGPPSRQGNQLGHLRLLLPRLALRRLDLQAQPLGHMPADEPPNAVVLPVGRLGDLREVGAPVNVVVADKDLTDVRLTFVAQ